MGSYWDTHPVIENPPVVVNAFKPSFRTAFLYVQTGNGIQWFPTNSDYFADFATAQWIANKYGDGKVYEMPFEGAGFMAQCSQNIYCTKLLSGRMVNCGVLAAVYARNPEDQHPGLAEVLIRQTLAVGG